MSDAADIVVRLHRSLYPPAAVARAAERFAAFGPAVTEGDADVRVAFSPVPDRLRDRLPDEFRNHALFEAIVAARVEAP